MFKQWPQKIKCYIFWLLTVFTINSCYYLKIAAGHLDILWNKEPISKVVQKNQYPEHQALLQEIAKIKEFAISEIGLQDTTSYVEYYHSPKPGITHVLTAAPATKLEPYQWDYVFMGKLPYKGYYDAKDFEIQKQKLIAQGLDIWDFYSIAYSTLGWFSDPVTTQMLGQGLRYLAQAIMHEMTHETYFRKGAADFNEQLASFVGNLAAQQYIDLYHPSPKAKVSAATNSQRRQKWANYQSLMWHTRNALQHLYDQDIPEKQKLLQKAKILKTAELNIGLIYPKSTARFRTVNNARLLQLSRYYERSRVFDELWEKSGQDWPTFWQLVRVAKN